MRFYDPRYDDDIENWYDIDDELIEGERVRCDVIARYYITQAGIGYVNGHYDDPGDYPPLVLHDMQEYLWSTIYDSEVDGPAVLDSIGREAFDELSEYFMRNESEMECVWR